MILVDSSVIIDVVQADSVGGDWSRAALTDAAESAALAINPVIYAEISVSFSTIDLQEDVFQPLSLRRLPLPYVAGFLAGKAHLDYRRRGGARTSPMPDFYIGAHAAAEKLALLTRDPRWYARYFPTVRLIAPEVG